MTGYEPSTLYIRQSAVVNLRVFRLSEVVRTILQSHHSLSTQRLAHRITGLLVTSALVEAQRPLAFQAAGKRSRLAPFVAGDAFHVVHKQPPVSLGPLILLNHQIVDVEMAPVVEVDVDGNASQGDDLFGLVTHRELTVPIVDHFGEQHPVASFLERRVQLTKYRQRFSTLCWRAQLNYLHRSPPSTRCWLNCEDPTPPGPEEWECSPVRQAKGRRIRLGLCE